MIMRDSVDPFAIPLVGLSVVAGYADGLYEWTSQGWARFPASIVPLSIVVNPANVGDILDVESGDASPGDCPGWADRFKRDSRRLPTIYCNRGTIGAVRQAMGNRPFDWWAATLDGTQDVPGAVAVQWAGAAITGGNYDESVIWDPAWGGGLAVSQLDDIHGVLFDSSGSWPQAWLRQFLEGLKGSDIANIQASVNKLSQPSFTLDQASLDAIASAIAKKLGKDLSNG